LPKVEEVELAKRRCESVTKFVLVLEVRNRRHRLWQWKQHCNVGRSQCGCVQDRVLPEVRVCVNDQLSAFPEPKLLAVEDEILIDLVAVAKSLFVAAGRDALIKLRNRAFVHQAVLGSLGYRAPQAIGEVGTSPDVAVATVSGLAAVALCREIG